MKPRRHEFELATLLTAQEAGVPCAAVDPGDRALLDGRFGEAVEAYSSDPTPSEVTRAKLGYAMSLVNRSGAADYLTTNNVGPHSTAKAVLAWELLRRRAFGQERKDAVAACRKLLQGVLDAERPSKLALYTLLDKWFTVFSDLGRPLEQARRASTLYPGSDYFLGILAREQRIVGEFPTETAARLGRTVDTSPDAGVVAESYWFALELGDWVLLDQVLARIQRAVSPAALRDSDPLAARDFAVASTFADMHRGRCGHTELLQRGWSTIEPWIPSADSSSQHSPDDLEIAALALCLAAEMGDGESIADVARRMLESVHRYEPDQTATLEGVHLVFAIPECSDVVRIEVVAPLASYNQPIRNALDEATRLDYSVLWACCESMVGLAGAESRALLLAHGPERAALCHLDVVSEAITDSEQLTGLGTVYGRLAVHADAQGVDEDTNSDEGPGWALEGIEQEIRSADPDRVAVFFDEVWSTYEANSLASGGVVLRRLGDRIEATNPSVLRRFVERFERLTGRPAPLPSPEDRVRKALAVFPDLGECPSEPRALSLLQAAALIAVVRGAMDHTGWTVAPLELGNGPFEPQAPRQHTHSFKQALFDLAFLGAIGFSDRTPPGVLSTTDTGVIRAHLERVVWKISPRTLALQRAIRDLPRSRWPIEWRESAPILARDVGAQELLAYMLHRCDELGLPDPDHEKALPALRGLLEKRSIAHGVYLVHKTTREALEYRVKFRAGVAQTTTRIQTLLAGNIAKSLEQGWDTNYRRDRRIPESQLFSALHDVLTGWGQRAFDEPVFELPLD